MFFETLQPKSFFLSKALCQFAFLATRKEINCLLDIAVISWISIDVGDYIFSKCVPLHVHISRTHKSCTIFCRSSSPRTPLLKIQQKHYKFIPSGLSNSYIITYFQIEMIKDRELTTHCFYSCVLICHRRVIVLVSTILK